MHITWNYINTNFCLLGWLKRIFHILFYWIYLVVHKCVCVHVSMCVGASVYVYLSLVYLHATGYVWRLKDSLLESWFTLFTMWLLGSEFILSGVAANSFTHWVISMAKIFFLMRSFTDKIEDPYVVVRNNKKEPLPSLPCFSLYFNVNLYSYNTISHPEYWNNVTEILAGFLVLVCESIYTYVCLAQFLQRSLMLPF